MRLIKVDKKSKYANDIKNIYLFLDTTFHNSLKCLDKELEAVIKTIKTNLTFPIITTIDKVIITRYDVSPGEQIAVFNLKK